MVHLKKTANAREPSPVWPLVVGTVHSVSSLQAAIDLGSRKGGPDLIELRVDHFAHQPQQLDQLTALAPRPFIVTVRDLAEGGAVPLSLQRRQELYSRFAGLSLLVDTEVRSLATFAPAIRRDFAPGNPVLIASFHDFARTPALSMLREQAARACDSGAELLKVAALTRTGSDLAVLLEFVATERRLPLAVMGMGPLGRASRPVLAAAGSVLNYGFLDDVAQVSGQWPAALLRERIDELLPTLEPSSANEVIARVFSGSAAARLVGASVTDPPTPQAAPSEIRAGT